MKGRVGTYNDDSMSFIFTFVIPLKGVKGVKQVLQMLKEELDLAMVLSGEWHLLYIVHLVVNHKTEKNFKRRLLVWFYAQTSRVSSVLT